MQPLVKVFSGKDKLVDVVNKLKEVDILRDRHNRHALAKDKHGGGGVAVPNKHGRDQTIGPHMAARLNNQLRSGIFANRSAQSTSAMAASQSKENG